jgi:hypothetical protein
MYLISKDEYEASKQSKDINCVNCGSTISDSHVNNIDVSHGGTLLIAGGETSNAPSPHSPRGASAPTRRVVGMGSYPTATTSSPSLSKGAKKGRRGRRQGRDAPSNREQAAGTSITTHVVAQPSDATPPPPPHGAIHTRGEGNEETARKRFLDTEETARKRFLDTSIPPPPSDLRRRAINNSALASRTLAKKERHLMKRMVEDRVDQLTGKKRRRVDPVGDASQLIHDLRDASRRAEKRPSQVEPMDVDVDLLQPPPRGLQPPSRGKKRKEPFDVENINPTAKRRRQGDLEGESIIIPRPPPPGRTLGHYGGKKRRRTPDDWEYEEYFDPNVRDALPPAKRRPDISQVPPIIPRPPPPGRTLGQYGGKKRRRDLQEWEYEQQFDPEVRDALPPAKRMPDISQAPPIIPRPPPPGRTLGQYGGKKRRRDLQEWEYEEHFDPNVRDALPPAKRRPEVA